MGEHCAVEPSEIPHCAGRLVVAHERTAMRRDATGWVCPVCGETWSEPKRIQLRRTKGYRKPEGAVVVARPSVWGNPYKVDAPHPEHGWPMSREETVVLYRRLWEGGSPATEGARSHIRRCLRGRDLACWCPLNQPCHADVLLEVANA